MQHHDARTPDLIAALTAIQEEEGQISADALRALSERERVPLYHLHGLVTFYPHLRAAPGVEIGVCTDLACHLRGAGGLLSGVVEGIRAAPGVKAEVRGCSCLGLCERAPAVMVGQGPVAPASVAVVVEEAAGGEGRVRVKVGVGGPAALPTPT